MNTERAGIALPWEAYVKVVQSKNRIMDLFGNINGLSLQVATLRDCKVKQRVSPVAEPSVLRRGR